VGNALKFTYKGHIKIKVFIVPEEKGLIKIEVEDTGIGIKEENLERLFKLFSKIDDARKHNKTGTGLGLLISNKLA